MDLVYSVQLSLDFDPILFCGFLPVACRPTIPHPSSVLEGWLASESPLGAVDFHVGGSLVELVYLLI